MSEINKTHMREIFHMMGNSTARTIIKLLDVENALSYKEIKNSLTMTDGLPAYYLRKMERLGLVRHDAEVHRWYLSRVSIKLVKVIRTFEKYCTEYDMNDVDSDGKVKIFVEVVGRKI